jgi:hypothetical protein
MVSNRCKLAVQKELTKLGLHYNLVDLGEVDLLENITKEQREQLQISLLHVGLELMDDRKTILIERIKNIMTMHTLQIYLLKGKGPQLKNF